jgi:hypothetical protein
MTLTEIPALGVVDRAKAKVDAVEAKGASYIPQILDAHKRVVEAERSGHQRSLECAIAAGELLLGAKEAIKGHFKWTEWREEYLGIPQTTASLYIRVAKNKDRLLKPNVTTEDGKRISNGVANLAATGQCSLRKVAALLVEKKPRGATTKPKPTGNEAIGKEWLKTLAPDELVIWVREIHGVEFLKAMVVAVGKTIGTPTIERRV